jgi:hypothetical protein
MTPAEPAPGQLRRDLLPLRGGARGQEAVTSGVTEALVGQDAAVWHQKADLPDPGAPSRLIEPAAATSRFLDVPSRPLP